MLKRLVKSVLPGSAVAAVNHWRMRERLYKSWSEAAAAAPAYGDKHLTAFRIKRSRQLVGQEESYVQLPADLLPAMDVPSGRFVDFGGSAGEFCAVLRKQFPAWSFTIVETKSMAEAAKDLRPGISYSDQLPAEFDVFYSSGTLQYLADPEKLWREALSRTTRYAYLARNAFSNRKLFTVQSSRLFDNGAGPVPEGFDNVEIRYPHQTVSEASLRGIADEMGFDLAARFEGRNSGVIGTRADVYGADLLFKRR
ncbi:MULTISPECIES: hypothetical protein [Rhizobium]|uniref:methyltransferase domain-containing protein n=1 Tax=Rhizobium TaxID=379 RepID=UPI001B34182B|nr:MULTISPECIES: hypothetical protein [Rhizobium]MBX4908358.1 hypothetical protein [Rhizobium bangladeshense]MBX5233574.1 hypothetical protein [Rhizobium sp. NLR4a]MBX5251213.1 hypothetical protein [Rhizobium sp. NLR4b]MBX5257491.1 hypothetical protein [Rhizobium sp. NLR16b]MBX5263583.1 hypothetical protein [Rhizobium sp. NLR16a]